MEETINLTNEKPSKYKGLGAELIIGLWFGIKAIFAVMMVHSLEYCIEELLSRKCQ